MYSSLHFPGTGKEVMLKVFEVFLLKKLQYSISGEWWGDGGGRRAR